MEHKSPTQLDNRFLYILCRFFCLSGSNAFASFNNAFCTVLNNAHNLSPKICSSLTLCDAYLPANPPAVLSNADSSDSLIEQKPGPSNDNLEGAPIKKKK